MNDDTPPIPAKSEEETYRLKLSNGEEYGPVDLDMIVQWARQGRIPRDGLLIPKDGGEPKSVFTEPRLASILATSLAPPTMPVQDANDNPSASGEPSIFLPTGNQPALWGYYLAVISFIMWPLMPVALGLGIIGLIRSIRNPKAKGGLHALVAIVLSLLLPVAAYYLYHYIESF